MLGPSMFQESHLPPVKGSSSATLFAWAAGYTDGWVHSSNIVAVFRPNSVIVDVTQILPNEEDPSHLPNPGRNQAGQAIETVHVSVS